MRNVTLSADERLVESARQKARQRKTTLNAEFRAWLERYVGHDGDRRVRQYRELMASLDQASAGGRFTREEMNER